MYNPNTAIKDIEFELYMTFTGVEQLREAIQNYAVGKGKGIWFPVNEPTRVQALWKLWASYVPREKWFQIKAYPTKFHICIRATKIKIIRCRWLADKFGGTIRIKPRIKLRELQQAIKHRFGLQCSISQCLQVKKIALSEIEKTLAEHYEGVWDYGQEILNTNPGSTVQIRTDQGNPKRFQRMYLCFDAVKKNWLEGCSPIIGLDGCFLKTYCRGELLSAVGRDANNQMFPIAWAVVESENKDSWSWFLNLLVEDVRLEQGHGWTLITDQQKGLVPAIQELLPQVEHRCCARHIYANWRKKFPGAALKVMFWKGIKGQQSC